MFRYLKIATPLCAAAIFAAACGNPSVEAARALKVEGNDAAAEAAREYRRLAYFEDKMMWDDASAIAFREKALTVQRDGLPRMLTPAALNEATPEEIKAAYRYLNALMASGAAELAPKSTGAGRCALGLLGRAVGRGLPEGPHRAVPRRLPGLCR